MNILQKTLALFFSLVLIPLGYAQDTEPVMPPSPEPILENESQEKDSNPGSHEVEYSEDNYRRFMELKDQSLQKSSMPTNAYQSGTQKLDELPEASQKHLRNQLREVILQEGKWATGDEDKEYPYVPSEAAQGKPGLKQQEAEAWEELVGKYQEREAQLHSNSTTSGAPGGIGQPGDKSKGESNAQATSGGSGGKDAQKGGDKDAKNQQKQSGQGQQSADSNKQGSYDPASSANPNDPNARSTAGVSQNALEFLQQGGKQGTRNADGNSGSSDNNKTGTEASLQTAQGQTGEHKSSAGANPAPSQQKDPDAESTSGISQNALEFLKESSDKQNADASRMSESNKDSSPEKSLPELPALNEAVTENASQQDNRQSDTTTSVTPPEFRELEITSKGTLSIKDLKNAQGVGDSAGNPSALKPAEETEKEPQKDGDG